MHGEHKSLSGKDKSWKTNLLLTLFPYPLIIRHIMSDMSISWLRRCFLTVNLTQVTQKCLWDNMAPTGQPCFVLPGTMLTPRAPIPMWLILPQEQLKEQVVIPHIFQSPTVPYLDIIIQYLASQKWGHVRPTQLNESGALAWPRSSCPTHVSFPLIRQLPLTVHTPPPSHTFMYFSAALQPGELLLTHLQSV